MQWSFSTSRLFMKCQRQWYYKQFVAHHSAKDPIRREAYILSKLKTLYAWRGDLVDKVLSEILVPSLNRGNLLGADYLTQQADRLFRRQLTYAKEHHVRDDGFRATAAGDSFAAFSDVEYGVALCDADIDRMWDDIACAIQNVYSTDGVIDVLEAGDYRVAQRALSFKHSDVSVRAVPDLIIFSDNNAPVIIDWKVHTFGTTDYRLQLALYALALLTCAPHKDFPQLSRWNVTDVTLYEVQLLTGQLRKYELSHDDVDELDSYIASTATQMLLASAGGARRVMEPSEYPTTRNPGNCSRCNFRKLCWENGQ